MKKKILVIIMCAAVFSAALGEEMPQWTEQTEYLYGMYITDIEGETLPPSPMDVSVIRNGVSIEIINGMPYSDRFMLLIILDGHVQPFYTDDIRYDFLTDDIDANGHEIIQITFRELHLADAGVHYMHILCVGLLDRLPDDEYDAIADYAISVTLPFTADEAANTSIEFIQPCAALPEKIINENSDHYCRLNFLDRMTDEGIFYPSFVQEISGEEAEFTLVAAGDFQIMQVIIFCDDKPYAGEEGALPCFWVAEDMGWIFEYELPVDTEGVHQTFAIALPLFNKSVLISATPKIRFDYKMKESDE